MGVTEHQFNAILWAVWGQGTRRLVWERPNGDIVADLDERLFRVDALKPADDVCPYWSEYRSCAGPIVTEAARERFAGKPDEIALQLLFQQLQREPGVGIPVARRVSQHTDLDRIVEVNVWPWLEWNSATGEEASRSENVEGSSIELQGSQIHYNRRRELVERLVKENSAGGPAYREQIEPLAKIAYRFHALGTQVDFFAKREREAAFGAAARTTALDNDGVHVLRSCATVLMGQSGYARACAMNVWKFSAGLMQHTRISDAQEDHQWWADLTTRPIRSGVDDAVANVRDSEEMAAVLEHLADDVDAINTEFGDVFERIGWNRSIAGGAVPVGEKLRSRSRCLVASDQGC